MFSPQYRERSFPRRRRRCWNLQGGGRMKAPLRGISVWALFVVNLTLTFLRVAAAADDPLPSWNDTAAKQAIVDFVRTTTDKASPKFVPPEARIATFDNDGTLWLEHPMYRRTQLEEIQNEAHQAQH